jgi:hypothetical protein
LNTLFCTLLSVSGCATYQTPGKGVNIGNLSKAPTEISELMTREPAASFPARLAVVRVQAPGYFSGSNTCYGRGQYCVVTTRDVETEQAFEKLTRLPLVAKVAVINRLLLPPELDTIKDLRLAAASLKTDILLVYSLDTRFNIENTDIGPLALISLGFLPNKNAHVTTTASGALFDVRTGFIYGALESTATEEQRATFWSSKEAIENARLKTEAEAFQKLVGEFDGLWNGIIKEHAGSVQSRN